MSAEKHTPGPWTIWDKAADDNIRVERNGHGGVCKVAHGESAAANARLIAAAPELLQALRALSDICAQGWIPPDEVGAASPEEIWNTACAQFRHSRAFEMALAAIKRAEGE